MHTTVAPGVSQCECVQAHMHVSFVRLFVHLYMSAHVPTRVNMRMCLCVCVCVCVCMRMRTCMCVCLHVRNTNDRVGTSERQVGISEFHRVFAHSVGAELECCVLAFEPTKLPTGPKIQTYQSQAKQNHHAGTRLHVAGHLTHRRHPAIHPSRSIRTAATEHNAAAAATPWLQRR